MYVLCNVVARSRNHCSSRKTTRHYVRIVELHVTVNNINAFLRNYVASKNKTYLGLLVKSSIFLSDFNQIRNLSTDFYKNSQYQGSRKSVQWEPHRYMQTGGGT
jgi:nucleoid-associated protein YejK